MLAQQPAPGGLSAGAGSLAVQSDVYLRTNLTYSPSLTYRHQGPIWRAEAGVGHSRGITAIETGSRGAFFSSRAQRAGVTLAFEDIQEPRPGRIVATDAATGAAIDPFNLSSLATHSPRRHITPWIRTGAI